MRTLQIRNPKPDFDAVVDRLWFEGDPLRTAVFNAYTMLLCDEFEIVRAVKSCLNVIREPGIRSQLHAWLGQEASHGTQHRRACKYLDRVPLIYRRYHQAEKWFFFRLFVPSLGLRSRLALVAGLEHFNTFLGELFLRNPAYFNNADPEMSKLLSWHFAEEIEHRSVIHDVCTHLGVGFARRVIFGLIGFLLYAGTLSVTTFWFLCQHRDYCRLSTYRGIVGITVTKEGGARLMLRYLADYIARSFHPSTRKSDSFADRVLLAESGKYACR